jgi:hypothetical protein
MDVLHAVSAHGDCDPVVEWMDFTRSTSLLISGSVTGRELETSQVGFFGLEEDRQEVALTLNVFIWEPFNRDTTPERIEVTTLVTSEAAGFSESSRVAWRWPFRIESRNGRRPC